MRRIGKGFGRAPWWVAGLLLWGCGTGGDPAGGDPGAADGGTDVLEDLQGDPGEEADAPGGSETLEDPGRDEAPEAGDPDSGIPDAPPDASDPGPELPPPEPSCHGEICAADADHAPDPGEFGPFPVGVRRYVFVDPGNPNPDGSPRVLKTEIWYPATEAVRGQPGYAYDIKADATDAVREKYRDVDLGVYPTEAIWEAPVRVGNRPWPLVLFSHGAFGIRYQTVFLTVVLASHGYVVVSPDHQDNTLYEILMAGWDPATLVESALRRPNDLLFLMDEMARKAADPADPFYGRVDPETVGVTGHSFGGLTAYVIAGDPRVKALVPMAPEGSMVDILAPEWGSPPMAELSIPTMMMGGMMDRTLDYGTSQWNPWNEQRPPKWFLSVRRGGHYTFTDICRMNLEGVKDLWSDAGDALKDGCDPVNNWAWPEAQKAVNQYAISFLNRFLRGSEESARYMTAEAGAIYGDEITFHAVPE
ncbi:dienelactone hydrolase family protein [Myxococcota bacterium]|nr:dienelactone hydrolase family protein [Myxococcota bacterium]